MFTVSKKEIILTDTICEKMELLRSAIETHTGERIRFKRLDFNSCVGQVYVGETVVTIRFLLIYQGYLKFAFLDAEPGGWFRANFSYPGKIEIVNEFPQE